MKNSVARICFLLTMVTNIVRKPSVSYLCVWALYGISKYFLSILATDRRLLSHLLVKILYILWSLLLSS